MEGHLWARGKDAGMLGVLGYRVCMSCLRFKQLVDRTTDGSKGICPLVTATIPFPASIVVCVFFSPVEFFGNFTTCSTPNKFSTWTMGGLRQGMNINLHSALLWSLKKTLPLSPLRSPGSFCLPSFLSHPSPWPWFLLGKSPCVPCH